jgi:hypothetical protein
MRPTFSLPKRSSEKAAALIIVLAFVVLLTGLAVAYLSRATTDRQLAHTSFHDTDADLLARSALDIVVGDFKQEIVNGSVSPAPKVSGTTVYIPSPSPSPNVVPQRNVSGIPNLIRRSVRSDTIPFPAVLSRASAVNSQDNPSANGRSISSTRWNSHYLVPKGDTTTSDSSPIPAFTNATPDWVFVKAYDPITQASPGPTVIPSQDPLVVGRYAYAVYDEGGLLDINVAGYPIPSTAPASWTTDVGRKGALAFADLTALPATTNDPPNAMTSTAINQAILFRNYATSQISSVTLGDSASVIANAFNSGAPLFANYYLGNPRIGTSQDFGSVNPTKIGTGSSTRTDQNFATRAELIALFRSGSSLPQNINALQYLGTFSREQNKPTLPLTPAWPASNRIVLPQRFYLGNLDLVQATTGTPTPTPTGTPTPTPSIRTSFGLQMGPNGRWQYVGPPPGNTPLPEIPTPAPGGSPAPDFFQILSYAYSSPSPTPTVDKILSLGAAIIDLYDYDTPSQVTTGVEYGTGPFVAGGAEGCYPNPCTSAVMMGSPTPTPTPIAGYTPAIQTLQSAFVQNQRFRNGGEMGYAYNPISTRAITAPTLDFIDAPPPIGTNVDAYVLDFFTYNNAPIRSGIVSLNTRQVPVLAAILKGAIYRTSDSSVVSSSDASTAANAIVTATTAQPAMSRADIARLASAAVVTNPPFTNDEEARDTIARALSEVVQTRTWGLLIDLVAQTGHYKPNATSLTDDFIVEGEKHYWLHIAIDRFDGTIVGQQLEEVIE